MTTGILFFLSWVSPRTVSRDELLNLFWPDDGAGESRHRLSQHLYRIRHAFPGILLDNPHGIRFAPGSVFVEEREFLDAAPLNRILPDPSVATGAFCFRLRGRLRKNFGDWIDGLAVSYEAALHAAIERERRLAVDKGDWQTVQQLAEWMLKLDPTDHSAHYERALAVAADGALGAALRLLSTAPKPVRTRFRSQLRPASLAEFQRTLQDRRVDALGQSVPRFVGRRREFAMLIDCWDVARRGSAKTVLIRGEPGIGKSRLAERLLRTAVLQGARAFYGRATEAEAKLPFSAFRDCMLSTLRDVDLQRLDAWAQVSLGDLFPGLLTSVMSDQQAWSRSTDALIHLMRQLLKRSPVVVFLDDAHWADTATLTLLSVLQRSFNNDALLIVLAYRPEVLKGQWLESVENGIGVTCERLDLGPVSDSELEELLDSVDAALECRTAAEFRVRLRNALGGRPLLLLETVRDHKRASAIGGAPTCTVTGDRGSLLSPRVRELFEARLHRIAPPTRDLLTCLAVIGFSAEYRTIRSVLAVSEATWSASVDEAIRCGLVAALADRLVFTHDIVRDAVVSTAISIRIAELHEAVGRVLAKDPLTPSAVVAHHFDRAGCLSESYDFYMRAALEAERAGSQRAAAEHLSRAVDIGSNAEQRFIAADRRLQVLCRLRAFADASALADVLWPRYVTTRDSGGMLRCKLVAFAAAFYSAAVERVDTLLPRALDLCRMAQEEGHGLEAAESLCFAAEVGHDLADGTFMESFLPAMRHAGEQIADLATSAVVLASCANAHLLAVDASIADEIAHQALHRARASGQVFAVCRALGATGNALIGLGEYVEAANLLLEGSEIAQRNGMTRDWSGLQTALAVSFVERGEFDRSEAVLECARNSADHHQRVVIDANLVRVAFEKNDIEVTYRSACALQAGNSTFGAPWVDVVALSFRGLCAHKADRSDEVRSVGHQLVRIIESLNYTGFDLSFAALFLAAFGRGCGQREAIARLLERLSHSTLMAGALRTRIALAQLAYSDDRRLECRSELEGIRMAAVRIGAQSVAARAANAMRDLDLKRR